MGILKSITRYFRFFNYPILLKRWLAQSKVNFRDFQPANGKCRIKAFSVLFLSFAVFLPAIASAQTAVSTFNSTGIYWNPADGSASNEAGVEYRPLGASAWKGGHPLWFDIRDGEYRGSIVHLTPDTTYEIRLTLQNTGTTATLTAKTWSEDFPIAQTIQLPKNSSNTLVINQSGSESGYILYTPEPGQTATIDVADNQANNIRVDADHIIIRGLILKGASQSAIQLNTNSHDVVIEQNDISGWGRMNSLGWGTDHDAGIKTTTSSNNINKIIIQRNKIHHPRADANSWAEARDDVTPENFGFHPTGPGGIYFADTGGNHVIRYNEIFSDGEHYYNDGIGGSNNGGTVGNLHRDSDVYGNSISQVWDDAIEVEGGDINIRVWGNFLDHVFVGIATRDVNVGPLYAWRNIGVDSQLDPSISTDVDDRGFFHKSGSDTGGGVFFFHNTMLQSFVEGLQFPLGFGVGISGGKTKDTKTRNNIFEVAFTNGSSIGATTDSSVGNDFDYDLYNGRLRVNSGAEASGLFGVPVYDSSNDFVGEFYLAPNSPGVDAGVIIPNFNDDYTGNAPDMGAAERGTPPMQFGVNAYLTSSPPPGPTPDNTPPVVTAPANLTVVSNGTFTSVALGTATATDAVDGPITPTNNAPAGGFPLGTTVVTWSAQDTAGNIGTAIQSITVQSASLPSAGGVVFHDNFTGGSDNGTLEGTVPDTAGTSWVELENSTGSSFARLLHPENTAGGSTFNNDGYTYHANYGAVGSADVDIEATVSRLDTDYFQPVWILGRWADVNNMFAVAITRSTTGKARLYKIVSGTATLLGTSSVTPANGDTVKLEMRGSVIRVYINGGEEISVTESSDLTAAGKSGLGFGAIHNEFSSYDLRSSQQVSTFKVMEFSSTAGSPSPPALDTIPPVVTAPANVTVESTGTLTPVNLGVATATDNVSSSVNIVITNNAPLSFPVGVISVIWTATDEAGNSANATQTVTVTEPATALDTTPPVVTAPPDVTVETTGTQTLAAFASVLGANAAGTLTPVDIGKATATDNVGVLFINNDAPAGGFPVGTTVVTWSADDAAGNVGTAIQNVTVHSATPPGSGRVIFEDNLNGANGTKLDAHVPDTAGNGWSFLIDHGRDIFLGGGGTARSNAVGRSTAILYAASPAPTQADVDITVDMDRLDASSDDSTIVVFRYQDASNYYGLRITSNSRSRMRLYKVVGGTSTLLGTSSNKPDISNTSLKIEARGDTLRVYEDRNLNGGWNLEIDVTDSAIPDAGKVGYGLGAVIIRTDDITTNPILDKIRIEEFAP